MTGKTNWSLLGIVILFAILLIFAFTMFEESEKKQIDNYCKILGYDGYNTIKDSHFTCIKINEQNHIEISPSIRIAFIKSILENQTGE